MNDETRQNLINVIVHGLFYGLCITVLMYALGM